MDNASSQCRTLLGSSWNALLTETRQRPRGEGDTPRKSGGFRPGKCTWENAAAFASDVYKGFQRKEQAVAVAIDLEDAYNRVHSSWWGTCSFTIESAYHCSSSAQNGPTTRITFLTKPLQCLYTKVQADVNQTGPTVSHTGKWLAHTKHQRTPRRQLKQCNIWIVYPSSVTTPDLSSIHTRHKHCGAHLTTEQEANQCQQSQLTSCG